MPYTDQDLRNAVDAIFTSYDKDNSGTLDSNEVTNLINDALKHMKANRSTTTKEVEDLIKTVDKNSDGKVAKMELFEIFKRVANQ